MTDPNVTVVSDLRCLHLPRLLENYARAAEPLPTSDGDLEHLFHVTSIERLQALTIDDIKKEIQMIMWAHYELDVCRKDFVLPLDTVGTAANDDSKNQLVKVSSLRPAPGDLLLVRCVISEKVWQGAWLCVIITTVKPIK